MEFQEKSVVLLSCARKYNRKLWTASCVITVYQERGRVGFEDRSYGNLLGAGGRLSATALQSAREQLPWSRLHGQQCRIPNAVMHSLPAATKGCFVVRFSNNGK